MERSNFTQQKYNSLAEVVNRIDDASAACITAISGKAHAGIEESYFYNGVQEHYDGEFLNIYPLHTEFRPYSQEDQKKTLIKSKNTGQRLILVSFQIEEQLLPRVSWILKFVLGTSLLKDLCTPTKLNQLLQNNPSAELLRICQRNLVFAAKKLCRACLP